MPEPLSIWDGLALATSAALASVVLGIFAELVPRCGRQGTARRRIHHPRALSDADALMNEIEAGAREDKLLPTGSGLTLRSTDVSPS